MDDRQQILEYWERAHQDGDLNMLTGTSLLEHLRFLHVSWPSRGQILCVGIGDGRWVRDAVEWSCWDDHAIWTLDIVSRSVEGTTPVTDHARLSEAFFDLALSLWVAPHMSDRELASQLKSVVKSLTDDGVFAMYYNAPLDPGWLPVPACLGMMKAGTVLRTHETLDDMVRSAGGVSEIVNVQPHPECRMEMTAAHIRRSIP